MEEIVKKMIDDIHSFRKTQLIYVAAKLKISDHLEKMPRSIGELAELTETNEDNLYRVIRALTTLGIYQEVNLGVFSNTESSELLNSKKPNSLISLALLRGSKSNWLPWGNLFSSVKTGESSFQDIFGINLFDYYEHNAEEGELFNNSMSIFSDNTKDEITSLYVFEENKLIIDIGGGQGKLLCEILGKNKSCHGILYDLPHVVKYANKYINILHNNERIKVLGGSMFDAVPENGDYYIMKSILHDWSDEKCIDILKICKKNFKKSAKLLIMEMLIDNENISNTSKLTDVHMLVMCPGGKERSIEDFRNILNVSGFKIDNIYQDKSYISVLECSILN